jgi:hypothetical protein
VPLIEQTILELRQIAEAEQARYADNRIGIYRPRTVPTLRKRLSSRLSSFERLGGPELIHCWDLAERSHVNTYPGILHLVYPAMDEIARAVAAGPP